MSKQDMISLKESLEAVDRRETMLEVAVEAYQAALGDVDRSVFERWKDRDSRNAVALRTLMRQIKVTPDVAVLRQVRREFGEEVKRCGDWMTQSLAGSVDLRQALKTLSDACQAVTTGSERHVGGMLSIASNLDAVAKLDDINAIRLKVQSEVQRLVHLVAELREEKQALLNRLEQEVSQYRSQLAEAETLAASDPLTGLANRRELERRAMELTQTSKPFCIILLDLNRFKVINDRFGHVIGDEVLKSFAQRLRAHARPTDVACRWGGDEFLLLLNCSMRDAMFRAQQIQLAVCGRYALGREDKPVRLDVSASIGVAERRTGESLEALVERADSQLYQHKGPA
jgi:diguanylate cyclase (GGDEF)-like protein